ncbi:hypothetical protein P7H22_11350 [Paenibacillus larvae]|nr:hypothetical protein [Paenibacillus larvae]MDT2240821.1 hypothetical protein [Paenibacillus larvae]
MIRDFLKRSEDPGSFAGSNASFQPRASIVGSKLLATVDYETGHIVWQKMNSTAETFLSFLLKVMATYPTGKLALVLDNARIHRHSFR